MFSRDEIKSTVTKLNGANYSVWKVKMELILIKEDLWDVVSSPRPAEPNAAWLKKDGQARACIGLMVEDEQLVHFKDATNASDYWKRLKEHYEKPSLSTRVFVMKTICKMQLTDDEKMEIHINEMMRYIDQLAVMGDPLSESWTVAMLLRSLPESYDPLIVALEARSDENLNLTFVKGKLIEESMRKVHKRSTSDTAVMKVYKGKPQKDQQTNAKKCFYCDKVGHLKKDCRFYKEAMSKKNKVNMTTICDVQDNKTENCFWLGKCGKADWYIDSGAARHIANYKSFFETINENHIESVNVANGYELKSLGIGSGYLEVVKEDNTSERILVEGVLYVPSIECNLLSVKKLNIKGYDVHFNNNNLCKIIKNNQTIAVGDPVNDLFRLRVRQNKINMVNENNKHSGCVHEWHRKMGHRDLNVVKKMLNNANIKVNDCDDEYECEICYSGKMSRKPFPQKSGEQSKSILDLVHTDVAVMNETTPSGYRYFVTFIDDFSRYCVIYLLRNKSDVSEKLKEYFHFVKTKFNKVPKILRSDRGGEYLGDNVKSFLKSMGTQQQFTAPYTPQQNGVAERRNRYLVEMVRCMIADANLSCKLWGEAVLTANYIQNRIETRSNNNIPFEIWEGKKVDINQFEVFGSEAHVLIPGQKRKKLDQKTEVLLFMGYSDESKALRFLNKDKMKIVISRDYKIVKSNPKTVQRVHDIQRQKYVSKNVGSVQNKSEAVEVSLSKNQVEEIDEVLTFNEMSILNDDEYYSADDEVLIQNEEEDNISISSDSSDITVIPLLSETNDLTLIADEPIPLRRSNRPNLGVLPQRYVNLVKNAEPSTYKQALKCEDKENWINAMNEEMKSLKSNNTWKVVPLPEGRKAIGCKWIYKIKHDANGEIVKYKARLVAQGFSQKYGVDYDEVFAPVVRQSTLRMFLTMAGSKNYKIKHYDIKTAFLNGDLEEVIYMRQPPGYEVNNNKNEVLVCKLQKSLYGLKQAARCWNSKLFDVLKQEGFVQGHADPCLLKLQIENGYIFILVYVDDILVTTKNDKDFEMVEKLLKSNFELTNLGEVNFYLGVKIERANDGFYNIDQSQYIDSIVSRAGLKDSKISKIPIDVGYINMDRKNCTIMENNDKYQELIGCLIYLSVNSRPDISAAVSILSQHVSQPTEQDWTELKRLIKYIKGTRDMKLKLGSNRSENLIGYVDADWAQNRVDRKSNSGYVFKYNGGCVSWCCRKQQCVSLSSTEAEYIALAEAVQEAVWLRKLMEDFDIKLQEPTIIFEDNQSCIKLVDSEKFSKRTKHVDTKYHFVRDLKNKNIIKLSYCPTDEMQADLLTKPLTHVKFSKLRSLLQLY